MVMGDANIVATWNVPMSKILYKIEFCHGTTTGKRIVRVNDSEILRRDWMFKLVGQEIFKLNDIKCVIKIEAIGIFTYEYSLQVGGKSFKKFRDEQHKTLQVWHVLLAQPNQKNSTFTDTSHSNQCHDVRVCLEKESMNIWINGTEAITTGEFVENGGTRTHFEIASNISAFIESQSSGKRNIGIIHKLFVNGNLIEPVTDDAYLKAS